MPLDVTQYCLQRDRLFLIGGPCVIESEALVMKVAGLLAEACAKLSVPLIFKSSYDKANRTSIDSFRGPGLEKGLAALRRVREELQVPVLTDVHSVQEATLAAEVVDVLQIPAFLARQTDLLVAAGRTGKVVNLKKAQFMAPWDMFQAVEKVRRTGNDRIFITERGSQFGYNNLVVDMRSIAILSESGRPIVFDATHSVQLPGGQGVCSGGQRQFVEPLACAAVAAGAHGVFLETHDDPDHALCDGPNSLPLDVVPSLLAKLLRIHAALRH
ncbi:MAG: 3-deoxy-8-phosphooctulonate synthase [Deltaproteobacteria bacterium]|nr:3-deoxy-8-phosphooctulonate synthase [Deltaproteobacteria bacterium]